MSQMSKPYEEDFVAAGGSMKEYFLERVQLGRLLAVSSGA